MTDNNAQNPEHTEAEAAILQRIQLDRETPEEYQPMWRGFGNVVSAGLMSYTTFGKKLASSRSRREGLFALLYPAFLWGVIAGREDWREKYGESVDRG